LISPNWLHIALFSRYELRNGGDNCVVGFGQVICRLIALLVITRICGCSASGPEPPLETAYSAIGGQVK
jgi:hypothetical protein